MNYEEKYKAALERAKEMCAMPTDKATMEYIFPELKESEDERIRKAIKSGIKHLETQLGYDMVDGVDILDIYSWLEKQGTKEVDPRYENLEELLVADNIYQMSMNDAMVEEAKSKAINALSELAISKILGLEKQCEKPTDKVEPKFHEGEWLCGNEPNNYARFIQILEIVNVQGKERYRISRDIHNDEDIVDFGFVEKYYHKFDIQDARDGDVLYSIYSKQPFIYKERPQFSQARGYCCINKFGEFAIWNTSKCVICTDKYIPATKEQRDLLFQKMKEAGYKWYSEKKELKKDCTVEPI